MATIALKFKEFGGSWKNLGDLPAVKAELKLKSIEMFDRGKGKFIVFTAADGTYATAAYDSKNAPALKDAFLWEKEDGSFLVGMPEYAAGELTALDSL